MVDTSIITSLQLIEGFSRSCDECQALNVFNILLTAILVKGKNNFVNAPWKPI
jgi:hypothetical protein